jgi:hypothetical protein
LKILEIIHIRFVAEKPDSMIESIRKSIDSSPGVEFSTIYRRDELKTDLAIHLQRNDAGEHGTASDIGIRLASALKEFGLVEHTVWKETS